MGVDNSDCRKVAELIGFKVFINEFVAYTELGKLITNSETFGDYIEKYPGDNTWNYVGDDIYLHRTNTTLEGGILSVSKIFVMFVRLLVSCFEDLFYMDLLVTLPYSGPNLCPYLIS